MNHVRHLFHRPLNVLLLPLLLSACTHAPATVAVAHLTPASDAATGVLLRVQDAGGQEHSFTRDQLAALGLVSYTTPDPALKNRKVQYVGPLLSSVLRAAGVAQDSRLVLAAHDHYRTVLDLKPLDNVPLVLALEADGKPLKLSNQGPVYLVFPYQAYKLDHNLYDAAWVWQLERIEVK
ncbi:molybdopterin-dependent oxidoreductase (plasmid) [Deinococcus sp. KNUC1210]|uniref:molybdopterin-dependent oxidoreductase n=1 Tax=Deinococcus sp. KNUC1210 TaxID=2917691 RepID=UPI001EF0942F|nr:molybdopterin-dependent oxidoreductase [Deinococcus sp. KNUC1210]ULH17743.1 molybdopterin-dependent oxidoreductase [Deinococcus sp. KNUC1210]